MFAVRGFARGAVEQLALLAGLILGISLTVWVSQWVGAHWQGARPAVVFVALRWLVALLAGLAALSLCAAAGDRMRQALEEGPAGVADRVAGIVVGAVCGVLSVALVTIALLAVPMAPAVSRPVLAARMTVPVLHQAVRASGWIAQRIPAVRPLGRRFESAESRAKAYRRAS